VLRFRSAEYVLRRGTEAALLRATDSACGLHLWRRDGEAAVAQPSFVTTFLTAHVLGASMEFFFLGLTRRLALQHDWSAVALTE
jgi:hypothetical protein